MLDEIGDLPFSLQAKLLRFLQERTIERLGGRQEIPVDVRIVCATHQDLKALSKEGRFREDLLDRLAFDVLTLPPLRARSGDVVFADDEGYLTFVGRSDDVFKSSDYRISPFELESVLLEHEQVAEAAVVPSPDPIRLAIPKAYVLLVSGAERSPETALSIFKHLHTRLAPFKRIRKIELVTELPKTISGKIRRVQLRRLEHDDNRSDALRGSEFREDEFPELQKVRTAGLERDRKSVV